MERHGVRGPRRDWLQAQGQLRKGRGGRDSGAAWSPDSRRHPGSTGPGRQAVQRAPRAPHRCTLVQTGGLRPRLVRAAGRFPPPASGSLRTPLPERQVQWPASLPVAAGPYIRCPPALSSAAVAMLSRSRCVSRAFSRSLSAFQKVRSGRAGAPAGEKPAGGPRGSLGSWGAARRSSRAPRAPGRGGRGLGGPGPQLLFGGILQSPAAPSLPEAAGAPSPSPPHPLRRGLRSRPEPRPARLETPSLGGGAAESRQDPGPAPCPPLVRECQLRWEVEIVCQA